MEKISDLDRVSMLEDASTVKLNLSIVDTTGPSVLNRGVLISEVDLYTKRGLQN